MGADGNLESGSYGQKIPQVREISYSVVAAVKQKNILTVAPLSPVAAGNARFGGSWLSYSLVDRNSEQMAMVALSSL
jgi:hypothetical protein